jgi:hypothetical protein
MRGLITCHEPPAAEVGRSVFAARRQRGRRRRRDRLRSVRDEPVRHQPVGEGLDPRAHRGSIDDPRRRPHDRVQREPRACGATRYRGRMDGVGPFIVDGHVNILGYGAIMTPGFVPATQLLHERFGSGRPVVARADRARRCGSPTTGSRSSPTLAYRWDDDHVAVPPAKWNLYGGRSRPGTRRRGGCLLQAWTGAAIGTARRSVSRTSPARSGRIAEDGPEVFYRGDLARRMADDFAQHGGFVTYDDMADVPRPRRGAHRHHLPRVRGRREPPSWQRTHRADHAERARGVRSRVARPLARVRRHAGGLRCARRSWTVPGTAAIRRSSTCRWSDFCRRNTRAGGRSASGTELVSHPELVGQGRPHDPPQRARRRRRTPCR